MKRIELRIGGAMKTDKGIEQLENQLMQMLLDGNEPTLSVLRCQLGLARRHSREMSGTGFFIHFDVPVEAPRLPGNVTLRFGDVTAEIEGLQHGAGFVLFIDNGALTMLEGYTYDEPWPTDITSYQLSYMGNPCRDWQSLRDTPGWPSEVKG